MNKRKSKTNWLSRTNGPLAPYMCLCLSDSDYLAALEYLKISPHTYWVPYGKSACVHFFEKEGIDLTAVVCIKADPGWPHSTLIGLIVHEAVHIFQRWSASIGETEPAYEQQAYGIQCITQTLLDEYTRKTKPARRSK
jgi:hypothetical protein